MAPDTPTRPPSRRIAARAAAPSLVAATMVGSAVPKTPCTGRKIVKGKRRALPIIDSSDEEDEPETVSLARRVAPVASPVPGHLFDHDPEENDKGSDDEEDDEADDEAGVSDLIDDSPSSGDEDEGVPPTADDPSKMRALRCGSGKRENRILNYKMR
ncbi:hypothetical protein N9M16_01880 [Candidatus Dependentiae bacterium]|nr:hypothetical protein [Candidatus Dependentiae bacterium]